MAEEQRDELRNQIAVASTQLLQDPEGKLGNLRALLALAARSDAQARLQLPQKPLNYRIRHPTEAPGIQIEVAQHHW